MSAARSNTRSINVNKTKFWKCGKTNSFAPMKSTTPRPNGYERSKPTHLPVKSHFYEIEINRSPDEWNNSCCFLTKQLLRCRGRINNSSLPQTSKNPILLPSSHRYVDLLIRHTHELVKHSAMTNTLTTL